MGFAFLTGSSATSFIVKLTPFDTSGRGFGCSGANAAG